MAGIVAARAVARRGAGLEFGVATPDDDAAVRRLLRQGVLPGRVRVSFEREPDASLAASIEGDRHDVLLARDAVSRDVVAITMRSERDVFVNGEVARVGYLGGFRVDARCRRLRSVLHDGFAFCRSRDPGPNSGMLLTSFVADNVGARRLLIDRRTATSPVFAPVSALTTFVLPVRRSKRPSGPGGALTVVAGTDNLLSEIAECLQRNGARYQCAPVWTEADLRSPVSTRGLAAEDFIVARRGSKVVGCGALWDQRAFKQVVVQGYSVGMAAIRPIVNILSPFGGVPLPPIGSVMPFAYFSHVAIDGDDPDVFDAVLAEGLARARSRRLTYVVTAFAAGHALREAVSRRWRHRHYETVVHAAYWPGTRGESMARSFDGRLFHFEAAVL